MSDVFVGPRALQLFAFATALCSVLVACGGGNPPGGDASIDGSSSLDARVDGASAPADTFVRGDGVTAVDDRPSEPIDVMIMPGRCGLMVHDCICNCGANVMCQAGCIQVNPACESCVFDAQTECCPMQWMTFADCLTNSTCPENDEACLMRECGTHQAAFQACVQRQANMPSCQMQFRVCFGPEYPAFRCVGMQ